ncbi:MAG: N-acyl-D-amino acid deacylase [Balneolaceae bacterium]|nr:MAG: N-acyl-D-amino acid deacylase [Balneolaceae bacterium]
MKYLLSLSLSLLLLTGCSDNNTSNSSDILILNGTIADGTGGDFYDGDIIIRNGLIAEIGNFSPETVDVKQIIDASGKLITPGFIDTHSHGDALETPRFNNFLSMGVTTITLGQDGRSPGGEDVAGWMNSVEAAGIGPNIVHFVGQNTLRQLVDAPREVGLDPHYIEQMQQIISSSMQAGSFGMTTGLEYDHGTFADLPELIALAETVGEYEGLVMSHIRSEDDDKIEESIIELLDQGRGSGAAVHVSHIKIVYGNDPSRAEDVLALLDEARNEGLAVTADLYPYVASFTGIGIVFPEWALPPHDFDEIVETRRDELAEFLRNRIHLRNGPEATLFGTAPWAGKTLAEVADELNKPFEDVLIDDIGPRGASAAYFVMNEDVMRRFLADPNVMISSDGSPTMRHPRGYGSFARIIHKYVHDAELLSLEEAIHKMTGLPAQTLGLSDQTSVETPRGLIREGFAADLLIFDPASVRDNATFENPHAYAEGFDWVIVNGQPVIADSEKNSNLPGVVVKQNAN